MEDLQSSALPLGYAAIVSPQKKMERETGFEPATSTLARSHSTTELFPLSGFAFYRVTVALSSKKRRLADGFGKTFGPLPNRGASQR
jgi:hypothetical protein